MDKIKEYIEYLSTNVISLSIRFILLISYAILVLYNRNNSINILLMSFTFIIGYSIAEYQEYRYNKATKIDLQFKN